MKTGYGKEQVSKLVRRTCLCARGTPLVKKSFNVSVLGMLPHQKPSLCRWFHSNAWQPKNIKPPITVPIIHQTTSFFELRWPASTANTMVTELMMRIKVIKPTNTSGAPCSINPGTDWKTNAAAGHAACAETQSAVRDQ